MGLNGLSPEIVRFIRTTKGLTIFDVAEMTGVSPVTVSKIENKRIKLRGSNFELAFWEKFNLTNEQLKQIEEAYKLVLSTGQQ